MTNPELGDDLPIIDVRSPAERIGESGRAGFARLQDQLRASHFDIAALLWMVCIAGLLAVEIYGALGSNRLAPLGDTNGWTKATLLAQSGNSVMIFGSMIGVALAAWTENGTARAALVIAAVVGVWVVVANIIGIAVVFHDTGGFSVSFVGLTDNRGAAAIGQFMLSGLGALIALVALSLLAAMRTRPAEVAEVS
jgi:hypothetical protein